MRKELMETMDVIYWQKKIENVWIMEWNSLVQNIMGQANRRESSSSMKRISWSIHEFEDMADSIPAATTDPSHCTS